MKRYSKLLALLLGALLLTTACDPEVDDGPTRYTVVNALTDTEMWGGLNVYVYEYDANEQRIDSFYIQNPEYKKEYVNYPREETRYLKLRLLSNENTERWGDTIFTIVKDNNIEIRVNLKFMNNYCFNEPML